MFPLEVIHLLLGVLESCLLLHQILSESFLNFLGISFCVDERFNLGGVFLNVLLLLFLDTLYIYLRLVVNLVANLVPVNLVWVVLLFGLD